MQPRPQPLDYLLLGYLRKLAPGSLFSLDDLRFAIERLVAAGHLERHLNDVLFSIATKTYPNHLDAMFFSCRENGTVIDAHSNLV